MLKTPALVHNVLDYDVYVVTTLTSPVSQTRCTLTIFKDCGYPDSVVVTGRADRAQEIDLKNSTTDLPKILGRKNSIHTDLPPTKQSYKNNILTNSNYFKKQKHRIFYNHAPLVSYKRDKKVGTFLVRSSLKTEEQPDYFKRSRFNTRPFIQNTVNILGPKHSIKITDRFDRTSTNVTHYITCNPYKMAKQGGGEETT